MRLKRLLHPAMLGFGLSLWVFLVCPSAVSAEPPAINQKIVDFCNQHQGQKVGNGNCWALARNAVVHAGARGGFGRNPGKGDYVWGNLVYYLEQEESEKKSSGNTQDILPGDIIQFRDTRVRTKRGGRFGFKHHTAVVVATQNDGKELKLLHQNINGKKFVTALTIKPQTLDRGWIRVYRPQPARKKKKK